MTVKKNALRTETLLKGKYNILMPIGEGGFSITYLAERITDGKLFAVKELFNKQYMERSVPDMSISIIDISYKEQYDCEKKKFQDEWDFINRFKEYGGSVQSVESFEENNTSYIVMEHLPGGSIKDNVIAKGYYDADVIFPKIEKVLNLLEIMHQQGYVHGDISPDNIVMDQEGVYRLIDFGSVSKIGINEAPGALLRKEGYTPAEVYNKNSIKNQSSDIYSLCATLYYALTGNVPEDSLERLIIDEIQPLSELRPETDSLVNDLIMRGLSLDPKKRWGSVKAIIDEISLFYKSEDDRKKEESHKKRRRQLRIISAVFGAVVILAAILVLFIETHKELIKFRGAETQRIVFYYDVSLNEDEINILRNNITCKIGHITGEEGYIISDNNGYWEVILKRSELADQDMRSFLNKYFNFSNCSIGHDSGQYYSMLRQLSSTNITSIEDMKGGVSLKIDTDSTNAIKQMGYSDDELTFRISTDGNGYHIWDRNNTPEEGETYDMPVSFDSNDGTIYISDADLDGAIGKQLFIDCLSEQHIPIASYNYERYIVEESKQEKKWGANQVKISQIKGERVILDYVSISHEPNILVNTRREDDVSTLKKLLDTLEVPYACGWDEANESEFYIVVNSEDVMEIEAALLFPYTDLSIGSQGLCTVKSMKGIVFQEVDSEMTLEVEDGNILVKVEGDEEELAQVMDLMLKQNDIFLQLCINNKPTFQTKITELPKDGYLRFNQSLLKKFDCSNIAVVEQFVNFVNELNHDNRKYDDYCLEGAIFSESNGKPVWGKDIWSLNGCEVTETRDAIFDVMSLDGIETNWDPKDPSIMDISLEYDDRLKKKYIHPYEIAAELLNKIPLTNELNAIYFHIKDIEEKDLWYDMTVSKNDECGALEISWDVTNNNSAIMDFESDGLFTTSPSKRNKTIEYLKNEDIFSTSYLYPSLEIECEKKIEIDENVLFNVSILKSSQEQGYQLCYSIDNKTKLDLIIKIDQMAINGVMVDYIYPAYIKAPAFSSSVAYSSYTAEELNLASKVPFDNATIKYCIKYGDEELDSLIHIGNNQKTADIKEILKIDDIKYVIEKNDALEMYLLDIGGENISYNGGDKFARFLFVNKSDKVLAISLESLGFDGIWLDSFFYDHFDDGYIIFPYAIGVCDVAYYQHDLSSWGIDNPQEMKTHIRIKVFEEESNQKTLMDRNYIIQIK